jgi:putative phosphonate transport system ATP-binding protein
MCPSAGQVRYAMRDGAACSTLDEMSEAERRLLMRTDWGFVHQNPRDGLRMGVSAGANVGERLMAVGARHYGNIRATAPTGWRASRSTGAHRRQPAPSRAACAAPADRAQPRHRAALVFMDEPTGGLDVSVQARLLDLIRGLVAELGLAAIVVTHDLAVARLLAHA